MAIGFLAGAIIGLTLLVAYMYHEQKVQQQALGVLLREHMYLIEDEEEEEE